MTPTPPRLLDEPAHRDAGASFGATAQFVTLCIAIVGSVFLGSSSEAQTLRSLTRSYTVPYVGGALNPSSRPWSDQAYKDLLSQEFNGTVATTGCKPGQVNVANGSWDFAKCDLVEQYVENVRSGGEKMRYHYHALFMVGRTDQGFKPINIPEWWTDSNLSNSQLRDYFRAHVDKVVGRYGGVSDVWHVLNEAIEPGTGDWRDWPMKDAFGTSSVGGFSCEGTPCYVFEAFDRARSQLDALGPGNAASSKLLLTEGYKVHNDAAMQQEILRTLDDFNIRYNGRVNPLDGVGVQFHTNTSDRYHDDWVGFALEVAKRGYEFHITEFDVAIRSGDNEQDQKAVYEEVLERFIGLPNRGDFFLWDFTDRYSWKNPTTAGQCDYPTPFYGTGDKNGVTCTSLSGQDVMTPKPAYDAMRDVLQRASASCGLGNRTITLRSVLRDNQLVAAFPDRALRAEGSSEGDEDRYEVVKQNNGFWAFRSVKADRYVAVRSSDKELWPIGQTIGPEDEYRCVPHLDDAPRTISLWNRRYRRFVAVHPDTYVLRAVGTEIGDEDKYVWHNAVQPRRAMSSEPSGSEGLSPGAYPNPATGPVRLVAVGEAPADAEVVIYDLLGRAVLRERAAPTPLAGGWELSVEVGGLPPGVYVYRMSGLEGGPSTGRITVAR